MEEEFNALPSPFPLIVLTLAMKTNDGREDRRGVAERVGFTPGLGLAGAAYWLMSAAKQPT